MEVPEVQYATSDGHRLAWQQWGSGPDLFVIPPIISNVELVWEQELYRRALEYYGDHVRLTVFDKRGVGLSDRFTEPPTLEERCADILAVMDAAGLEAPAVSGLSEGGLLAQLFALDQPGRVSRLLLGNSSPGAAAYEALHRDPDGSLAPFEAKIERFGRILESWGTDPQMLVDWFNPAQSGNAAFVRWMGRFCRQSTTSTDLVAQMLSVAGLDAGDRLAEIAVPTLVTHATDDAVMPIAAGRWLAEHIPGARFEEMPGADHLGLTSPDWRPVADAQLEFVCGSAPTHQPERRLATVVFTDIVDSTRRAVSEGDDGWRRLLDMHDRIAWQTADRHAGTLVKNTGDGLLLRFDRPSDALGFAVDLRRALDGIGLPIRCGLHIGEIEIRADGDIAGLAVNLAARVEAAAGDGEIWVSSTVRDLLLGGDLAFEDQGEHTLKGFDQPWRLYAH